MEDYVSQIFKSLQKEVLSETYCFKYAIHLGVNTMYKDIKEVELMERYEESCDGLCLEVFDLLVGEVRTSKARRKVAAT